MAMGTGDQVETASESDASPSSCDFESHQTINFWTQSRDNRSNSHLFGLVMELYYRLEALFVPG